MKHILVLALLFAILLFSCGKKEANVTDTKKETPKTETKQQEQTSSPSSELKLPDDFPLKDDVFKKGTVTMASESSGLKTVNFKPESLPEDIEAVIDKELVKDGFKKTKEDKSDMLKETEWSKDAQKIGLDLQYANGKLLSVSVYYEAGK